MIHTPRTISKMFQNENKFRSIDCEMFSKPEVKTKWFMFVVSLWAREIYLIIAQEIYESGGEN